MPTYVYRCIACAEEQEIRHAVHDTPPQQCPTCGERMLRVIHAPALKFTGSGFYETDYRGKK